MRENPLEEDAGHVEEEVQAGADCDTALKESINKSAYAYTDKHLGPNEEIDNKGGSFSNRLPAAMT